MLRNMLLFITSFLLFSIISCPAKPPTKPMKIEESKFLQSLNKAKEKFDKSLEKNAENMLTSKSKNDIDTAVELARAIYDKTHALAIAIQRLEEKKSPTSEEQAKIAKANEELDAAVIAAESALLRAGSITRYDGTEGKNTISNVKISAVGIINKNIEAYGKHVDKAVKAGFEALGIPEPKAEIKRVG